LSKKKYLFIGLGTMGFHMAGHLTRSKHEIHVFNRSYLKTKGWTKTHKGYAIKSLNNISHFYDGIFLCLKDDDAIQNILFNSKLIESIKVGAFIVDHSTTSLKLVNRIISDNQIAAKKITFFDAPISGGEAGAINGTLSVMLGGGNKNSLIVRKLVKTYAKNIVHVGPNGHGQLTKMINQICIAGLLQGLSEALSFGSQKKLDMNKVLDAISQGAAQSWQMENRAVTMLNDKFNFGFAVDLMIKDLKIALLEAKSLDLNLKVTKDVLDRYKKLSDEGYGSYDTSSLIKLLK
jgi:3-hydroxyisobutyrate dehydrogenase